MTDTELQALTMLVLAEVSGMNAGNAERERQGYAQMYDDGAFVQVDCVRCLDAELRRRGVLKT